MRREERGLGVCATFWFGDHGGKVPKTKINIVFNTRKFEWYEYQYARNVIVWHHEKTMRWSRISWVDDLVVRMVRMRGVAFPSPGPPLDEATVTDVLTRRKDRQCVVRFNFYEQA